jgi:SOS-response transcriptional repressor LexA
LSFRKKLNNRLEQLIKERGINTHQLHKHTGIPLSTLHRLRLNKENNPTLASVVPIAKYFKVTVDQLIGINPLEKDNAIADGIKVPIIAWKNALKCKKYKSEQAFSSVLVTDISLSDECYALLIKKHQNLQWTNLPASSLLIIDTKLEPNNRDFIIAKEKNLFLPQLYQILIFEAKHYLKTSDSKSEIIPFTNNYKTLGIVVQIRMNYKNNRMQTYVKDKKTYSSTKQN